MIASLKNVCIDFIYRIMDDDLKRNPYREMERAKIVPP